MSKDNNKKAPKIRFPGFTDDWGQRKLGDISSLITKGTTPKDKSGNGDVNFIKVENINDFSGDIVGMSKISLEEHQGYLKRSQLQEGDILFSIAGTLGRVTSVNKAILPANTNQALSIIRLKEGNLEYVKTCLKGNVVADFIRRNPTIGAQPNLSLEQVSNLEIEIPSEAEQEKIGACFQSLDHLITLHQRKLEKLKEYKKGMLKKMFPKSGEKVPEVRFPGFDGEWEEHKVSELCSISTGKSNTQDKVEDGKYPFYVRSPIIERSTKYLYDEEAVITVGDGVGTGKVFHYVNGKYDLHQRCYRMYGFSDELNAHYFYHTFSKLFYKRVMAMTAKTSVDSVRLEMISDMKIPVPDIEEQRKIGSFLDNLDYLIALQQKKIASLKEFKKGCLQQMFV